MMSMMKATEAGDDPGVVTLQASVRTVAGRLIGSHRGRRRHEQRRPAWTGRGIAPEQPVRPPVDERVHADALGASHVEDLTHHRRPGTSDQRSELRVLEQAVDVHPLEDRVDVHLGDDLVDVDPTDDGLDVDAGDQLVEVGVGEQGVRCRRGPGSD